jgi:ferritin-like metal-binding protein YciE
MGLDTPRDLFVHELSDMMSAENIIYKVLGEMVTETKVPEIKTAFQSHLKETEAQIKNLHAVFKSLGEQPEQMTCHAAEGLKKEHDSLKEEKPKGHVLELGLLGGAGKTEHYEMASYTMLVQMAKDLGETEAARLLKENLDQEVATAKKVEALAKAVGKDAKAAAKSTAKPAARSTSRAAAK